MDELFTADNTFCSTNPADLGSTDDPSNTGSTEHPSQTKPSIPLILFIIYVLVVCSFAFSYIHPQAPAPQTGPAHCVDFSSSPGYLEVIAAGYHYKCVSYISPIGTDAPSGSDASNDSYIAGETEFSKHTILILDQGDERAELWDTAHENAHVISDVYEDTTAQAYYLSHTGLKYWFPTAPAEYFESGVESFADTFAMCKLKATPAESRSDIKLGSCDVMSRALTMMKSAT